LGAVFSKGGHMPNVAKPSVRFFHSAALRKRTDAVLSRIERDADATQHANALSSVVVELTEAGLDYYFLRPLQESKFGFVARQTANLGMSGALRVMSPIIGRILAGADTPQLRGVARHIRHLTESTVGEKRCPTRGIWTPPVK
jgi:hypothetical protein